MALADSGFPRVISFANQKGGVGKTTIAMQVAYDLARRGHQVLALDFDGQGNYSSRLGYGVEDQFPFSTRTAELYGEGDIEIKPVICRENLHLIYSKTNDADLFEVESFPIEKVLLPKMHIDKIKDNYDYIIVDCPPTLGRNLLAALTLSTHVITVVKVSGFAVDGAQGLMTTINGVQNNLNPGLTNVGFIVNMFDNSRTHWKTYDALKEEVGDLLFDNRINQRTSIDTATSEGLPVSEVPYGWNSAEHIQHALDEIYRRTQC